MSTLNIPELIAQVTSYRDILSQLKKSNPARTAIGRLNYKAQEAALNVAQAALEYEACIQARGEASQESLVAKANLNLKKKYFEKAKSNLMRASQ